MERSDVIAPRLDSAQTLDQALRAAVKDGLLLLQIGGESYYHESLPPDLALDGASVLPAPQALKGSALGPVALPEAWATGSATISRLLEALTAKAGAPVPWPILRDALLEGERQNIFSLDTAQLVTAAPAERAAIQVRPREITTLDTGAFIDASVTSLLKDGQASLIDIKAAIERARGVTIPDAVFIHAAKQAASEGKISLPEGIEKQPDAEIIKQRVQPKKTRIAVEARLNLKALADLPQAAQEIRNSFPDMNFEFRITISAEGEALSPEQVEQLNTILGRISPQLRLS